MWKQTVHKKDLIPKRRQIKFVFNLQSRRILTWIFIHPQQYLQNLILSLRGCFFRAICLFVYKNVVVVEKHSLRTKFSMCEHNSWLQNSRYRSLLFNFLRSLRGSILSARTSATRPLITKTSRTSSSSPSISLARTRARSSSLLFWESSLATLERPLGYL